MCNFQFRTTTNCTRQDAHSTSQAIGVLGLRRYSLITWLLCTVFPRHYVQTLLFKACINAFYILRSFLFWYVVIKICHYGVIWDSLYFFFSKQTLIFILKLHATSTMSPFVSCLKGAVARVLFLVLLHLYSMLCLLWILQQLFTKYFSL